MTVEPPASDRFSGLFAGKSGAWKNAESIELRDSGKELTPEEFGRAFSDAPALSEKF